MVVAVAVAEPLQSYNQDLFGKQYFEQKNWIGLIADSPKNPLWILGLLVVQNCYQEKPPAESL